MKAFRQGLFLAILFLTISIQAFAQNGSITGKIVDKKTGEELIGVSVQIQGTSTGAVTDFEGKYTINNVAPGTYTLLVSYVSYIKKSISGVEVKAKEATNVSISLEESTKELGEVVVQAEIKRETASGLLIQQKNAVNVSDGISAESIKKTPDRNTSDVLKRVSGASIQDNRFAIIRGLNERYTTAYINGAPLPSSESDRKAFSFDIFPSNLLDNLVITKTATPDLPAEFGGGIIEINTKSVPDENFQSISVMGGFNTITTFKDQLTYQGGKLDWLGIDDGTRAVPAGIPSDKDFPTKLKDQGQLGQYMKNDWAIDKQKFTPNYGFQYTMGHVWGKGTSKFGTLFALTYNRTNTFSTTIRKQYDSSPDPSVPTVLTESYEDKNYTTQTLSGILANLSYKINNNHQITFKNLYSINSDDRVIDRYGTSTPLDQNPTLISSNALWFTSNRIYSTQLSGNHFITPAKLKINWVGGYSSIEREIPDLRRNIYSRNQDVVGSEQDTVYRAIMTGSNVGFDYAGNRFYSSTQESIKSFKGDVARSFDVKSIHLKNMIKIGGLYQDRVRDFSARQLGYIKYATPGGALAFVDSLLYLPQDKIFSIQNMGQLSATTSGFALSNKYKPTDTYHAQSKLAAGFIMFDNRFKERYRLIWGVRIEKYQQDFSTTLDDKTPYDQLTTKTDILPSANFIYSITENQNFRLGYSQTVNRPEFRELAPFAFYDYSTRFVVSGRTDLKRALIHNYDARYEWYPGRGQMFSVSGFYKKFLNPIEQVMAEDREKEISYNNLQSAEVYGAEFEFRLLLGALFKSNPKSFLNNLTVFSNLSLIKSSVQLGGGELDSGFRITHRPLQGQSPYIINSGIQFSNEAGWTFSATYNKVGPRIYIVGSGREPDIWENGRDLIDLQIGKALLKNKLEIRFNVKDMLAQKQYFFQDMNHNQKLDKSTDNLIWVTSYGPTLSLTVTYKF